MKTISRINSNSRLTIRRPFREGFTFKRAARAPIKNGNKETGRIMNQLESLESLPVACENLIVSFFTDCKNDKPVSNYEDKLAALIFLIGIEVNCKFLGRAKSQHYCEGRLPDEKYIYREEIEAFVHALISMKKDGYSTDQVHLAYGNFLSTFEYTDLPGLQMNLMTEF